MSHPHYHHNRQVIIMTIAILHVGVLDLQEVTYPSVLVTEPEERNQHQHHHHHRHHHHHHGFHHLHHHTIDSVEGEELDVMNLRSFDQA